MISGCKASNLNIVNYLNINHPYQKKIRKCLEDFTECKIKRTQKGIDGCSAPQYAVSYTHLTLPTIYSV